jgi:hypothetical protein
MARKTIDITITAEGRDNGKLFRLTEMSAAAAERWAMRALAAIGQSGAEIPEDITAAGFAGIVALGIRAFTGIPWELAEPLLAEMMTCVAIVPDPSRPQVVRPLFGDDDIEEIATRLRLRDEVLNLHAGFSIGAYLSRFKEALSGTTDANSETMSTSLELSAP